MARPTKLTPEVSERLVRLIRAGNFATVASAACGICRDTFQRWLRRGAKEESGIYRDLVIALDEASAIAEARNVAIIMKAAEHQWQAAAWYLERRAPDRWGARGRGPVVSAEAGADGAKVKVEWFEGEDGGEHGDE